MIQTGINIVERRLNPQNVYMSVLLAARRFSVDLQLQQLNKTIYQCAADFIATN